MQDNAERRRDIRVHVSPPGQIVRIAGREPIEILNASFRGLFARVTNEPPQAGELIKLAVELPAGPVQLQGVAVRIVRDRAGRAGVGFRFFALNGETKRLWESYITNLLGTRQAAA
jgi:hypothetical protein